MLQTKQILSNSSFMQSSGTTLSLSGTSEFINLKGKPNLTITASNITLQTLSSGSTNNTIIDTSLVIGGGFDSAITVVKVQSDGKLVVGGVFTHSTNSFSTRIARFNGDGTPDTSFVPYINNIGFGSSTVNDIAIQSDGKILAVGDFTTFSGLTRNCIIRLNSNGTIDNTFTIGNGFSTSSSYLFTVAIQPSDGKIIAGGYFNSYSGVSRNGIIRLNTNGTVDNTFVIGSGFNYAASEYPSTIAFQVDGKILVGGSFTTYSGVSKSAILRLNTNGSIDNSFLTGSGFEAPVAKILVQSDGKILVGGAFLTYSGLTSHSGLIRLNTNGSIDNTFSIGTGFDIDGFGNFGPASMVIQPLDNKIVIGGTFTNYSGITVSNIIRLHSNGKRDATFNNGTGFDTAVNSVDLLSNGSILVGGSFGAYNGTKQSKLSELTSTGTLVNLFPFQNVGFNVGATLNQVLIQPLDGKYLIGGTFNTYSGTSKNGIIRLNTDGSIDNNFKTGAGVSGANALTIQSDNKIILGGSFTTYSGLTKNRIVRINSDGSIDSTFVIGNGFTPGAVTVATVQLDGKILVGGSFTTYSGASRNRFVRLNTDGSIDSTFTIGTGFNTGAVNTIQVQSDGKILVGGSFNSYSGVTSQKLIRLNSNGTVDFSYGTRLTSTVTTIAIQSNGKYLIGGSFVTYSGTTVNRIARLNTDGTLDSSFVTGTGFDTTVNSIKVQSDGYIDIVGAFSTYNSVAKTRIVRVNSSGGIDQSLVATNVDGTINSVAISNDHLTILIGGTFSRISNNARTGFARLGSTPTHVYIASLSGLEYQTDYSVNYTIRSLPDKNYVDNTINSFVAVGNNGLSKSGNNIVLGGTLTGNTKINSGTNSLTISGTSGTIGFVSTGNTAMSIVGNNNIGIGGLSGSLLNFNKNFGGVNNTFLGGSAFSDPVSVSLVQPDGKIIIGGGFYAYSGLTAKNLIRINTNGSIDTTFSFNTTGLGATPISSLSLQSNGKIVFTANSNLAYSVRIGRLNADGTYDNTFNLGSSSIGFTDGEAYTTAIQSDGKIVVGGQFNTYSGVTRNKIIRIDSAGRVDNTFTIGSGFGTGFTTTVNTLKIQPSDGKIVVGGNFTKYSGVTSNNIIRLNTNGTIDSSFTIGNGISGGTVQTLAIQSDGKIIVGGDFIGYSGTSKNRIVRLNTNGSVDNTFTIGSGFNNRVSTIAIQSDGKIIVGGSFTSYSGVTKNSYVRLNSNGTIDNTFTITTGAGNSQNLKIVTINMITGTTTSIFMGGDFKTINGISRINAVVLTTGGTVNTTMFKTLNAGFESYVQDSAVQPDGKIVVCGFFATYSGMTANKIARITPDGILDNTFNTGSGFNFTPYSVKAQSDGKILLGGVFTTYNGITANRIVRLNSDGSIDSNFSSGSGFNSEVDTLTLQPDGKILVGGDFSSYNGVTGKTRIIRLNSNGTIDNTFLQGTGANGRVFSIALQSNNKILLGGDFYVYSGFSKGSIIRLNTNGVIDNTFAPGSGFTPTNGSSSVRVIKVQSNDKILVGGIFTTYNSVYYGSNFIKLNSDGTVDTTLNTGGRFYGFGSMVQTILPWDREQVIVGGYFTTYKNLPAIGIIKLNSDGSVDSSENFGAALKQNNGSNSGALTLTLLPSKNIFMGGSFVSYNNKSLINGGIISGNYGVIVNNPVGLEYNADYSANFGLRSLVDRGYTINQVQTEKNVVILTLLTTTPYTATTATHYIHCSGTSAMLIYLPPFPKINQEIIVSDAKGNALTNNVTINANGKKINGATTALLNANYGGMTLVYNGINWHGVAH